MIRSGLQEQLLTCMGSNNIVATRQVALVQKTIRSPATQDKWKASPVVSVGLDSNKTRNSAEAAVQSSNRIEINDYLAICWYFCLYHTPE